MRALARARGSAFALTATMTLAGDIVALVKNGGWLAPDWQKKLPHNSAPQVLFTLSQKLSDEGAGDEGGKHDIVLVVAGEDAAPGLEAASGQGSRRGSEVQWNSKSS